MRVYDGPNPNHVVFECDGCGAEYATEEEADGCYENGCEGWCPMCESYVTYEEADEDDTCPECGTELE
jgi:hypothetical protein